MTLDTAPEVAAVGTALPPHYADQEALIEAFRTMWAGKLFNPERMVQLHRAVRVSGRHFALPLSEYEKLDSFAASNAAWARVGAEVGEQAIRRALEQAGLAPRDVDHLFFVTITGVGTPNLDVPIANRLSLRSDVKRTPIFGLGCMGGAGGLARAADYLRAFPDEVAVLLSVELCSLTLQREDLSVANLLASGLFGDGAAAVVLRGARRRGTGPRSLATRSVLYPNTEWVMGWDIVPSGFKVVLSPKVPEVVREHIRPDVDRFLAAHGLTRKDIRHWICHPGGPKVLEAIEQGLELPVGALDLSWRSLASVGNLSSASVLFILGDTLRERAAHPGDYGVLMAMGPGFGADLTLLGW